MVSLDLPDGALYKQGEGVPLNDIDGALGERKVTSYSFLTSALKGSECSASRPGRFLLPGKGPLAPIWKKAYKNTEKPCRYLGKV
jgi:hypothetical protein